MSRPFIKHVEPSDLPSPVQLAIAIFSEAKWGADSQWLAPLALGTFARKSAAAEGLTELVQHNLQVIARSMEDADGLRDRALLIAYARLCGCGDKSADLKQPVTEQHGELSDTPPAGLDIARARAIAKEFRNNGANFESALVQGGWPGQYVEGGIQSSWMHEFMRDALERGAPSYTHAAPPNARLMHILVDAADLDLTQVVDAGKVRASGSQYWGPDPEDASQRRVPPEVNRDPDSPDDARSLANWTFGLGPRAVRLALPILERAKSDRDAGAIALGARSAIEKWLLRAVLRWTYFEQAGVQLAEATRPYFDLLDARCALQPSDAAPALRRAWLWFAWCTFEADRDAWEALTDAVRERVLRAANEDLSRLRKLLSRATPMRKTFVHSMPYLLAPESDGPPEEKQRASWEEFEWEKDHLSTCLNLLFSLGGVWRGLKPALLAWRTLPTPAVATDLRYWNEPDREPPPAPWSVLVEWPINLFHAHVWREQEADPELIHLRGELAAFCLERLKDRMNAAERKAAEQANQPRTNEQMVERSPEWRYCLIRAVGSLGINPEGKGHRVLQMAADLDPEPDVRDAANQGFQQMRRGVGLPEGVSPRRAVMSALWWIRQAHLLGLEVQLDADGAQRTRVKELSRTKEAERADTLNAQEGD